VGGRISPYAGAILDITKNVSVYASYADIFSPTTLTDYLGQPLKPRTGRQLEAGVKASYFDGALNASLSVYNIRDQNRPMADVAHPGFYVAQGRVQSQGFDAEISGSPAQGLQLTASYTFLDQKYLNQLGYSAGKFTENAGTRVSYWYPRNQFKLWSSYEFQPGSALRGLSVGAGAVAMSGFRVNGNTATDLARSSSGYYVVNAALNYKINDTLTAQLNANNILDRRYWTRMGGLNTYNWPGEPRSVMFTLQAKM
jgi:outer membrane receptor for ferric coprogen and ferric-rhodotorulic acid